MTSLNKAILLNITNRPNQPSSNPNCIELKLEANDKLLHPFALVTELLTTTTAIVPMSRAVIATSSTYRYQCLDSPAFHQAVHFRERRTLLGTPGAYNCEQCAHSRDRTSSNSIMSPSSMSAFRSFTSSGFYGCISIDTWKNYEVRRCNRRNISVLRWIDRLTGYVDQFWR